MFSSEHFGIQCIDLVLYIVLVFADHFLWFKYFTTHYKPFMDIAAFFGLCVWLVPFAYFISLSANDNALPTSGKSLNMGELQYLITYSI